MLQDHGRPITRRVLCSRTMGGDTRTYGTWYHGGHTIPWYMGWSLLLGGPR